MPLSQFDERTAYSAPGSFVNGTGVGIQSLAVGSTFGTRIDQFILTWNGAISTDVDIRVDDGSGDIGYFGTVTLPAAVGAIRGQVDVIATLCPSIQPYILLPSGFGLGLGILTAITGTDVLTYIVQGGQM
jgi:hypothetical protein